MPVTAARPACERTADTQRFYGLLDRIAERVGGARTRGDCDGRMAWPRRGDCPLPPGWGIGGDAGTAARRLATTGGAVKEDEADLERRVSRHIGAMPLLWLAIDDPPGPESQRDFIERNAIALLSHAAAPAADPPSGRWLRTFSDHEPVRRSGLWNNHHVEESYDPAFLDAMERLVDVWGM